MTDNILRLGLDTTDVETGARRADQAYGNVGRSARTASDQNERVERALRNAGRQAALASQAMDQSARANGALASSARRAAESENIYARAARERIATQREVAAMATQESSVSAAAAAEAFVRAQENVYRANMARIKLAQTSGLMTPAEAAAQGQQAATAYNQAVTGVLQRRGSFRDDRGAFTTLAGSLKSIGESGRSATVGVGELRESMASLASQALGAHPVLGRVANVVGSFAIGGAMMVGVLGGLAALGLAWRHSTRDAREAREEHERLLGTLNSIGDRRRIDALGPAGDARQALAAGDAEAARIREEIERAREVVIGGQRFESSQLTPLQQNRVYALTAELRAVNQDRRAAREEIVEAEAEAEREITDNVRREEAERAELRREAVELKVRLLQIEKDAEARRADERRDDLAEEIRLRKIQEDAEARRAMQRREDHEFQMWLLEIERRAEKERQREEEEARRAQEQALNKLVQALNNVGRAYGGVTDQVLSLVGAVLSLERMPMDTKRDQLTAYGAAAATGIGIGHSTGSFALGAVGGAAAGASLAGPYGAIVGGVAGIVSGLTEQGNRAAIAAQAWDKAMERWEAAYETRTPFQDRMARLDQEFEAAAAQAMALTNVQGITPDREAARGVVDMLSGSGIEAFEQYARLLEYSIELYDRNKAAIEEWQQAQEKVFREDLQVRELRALGQDDAADALQRQLEQDREMQRALEAGWSNAAQEQLAYVHGLEDEKRAKEEAAEAIRSVTSALNDPSGLRLSLYRWRAEMMVDPSADTGRPPRDGVRVRPGSSGTDGDRRGGTTTVVNIQPGAIVVPGAGDPRRVAREVIEEVGRIAGTGGGDPFDMNNQR